MKLNILYEDSYIITCIKPAGLPTQSARIGTQDMESILKNHIHAKNPFGGALYLAIIHRLDQPVEGILVFAKTPFAAKELSRQITQKQFQKHYLALLAGTLPDAEASIEDYLKKNGRTNTSSVCTKNTPGAKLARLSYRTLCTSSDSLFQSCTGISPNQNTQTLPFSLVQIILDTGRHHQIRVQLSHRGCPILNDVKYAPASDTSYVQHAQLALCAYHLEFAHPKTKKHLTFEYCPSFLSSIPE